MIFEIFFEHYRSKPHNSNKKSFICVSNFINNAILWYEKTIGALATSANADGIVTRQGEAEEDDSSYNGSAFASEEYADEDEDEEAVLPENHAQQVDAWRQLFDPAERSILARDSKKRPSKRKVGDTVKRRKTPNTKYDPKTITPLSRVRLCSVFLTRSHCQSNAI